MRYLICLALILCLVLPCAALEPASVVSVFHIKEGKVTPVSATIVYGGSPNIMKTHGDYIVATRTAGGAFEKEAWIEDPALVRYLDVEEAEPSMEIMDDVDFTVILPFRAETAKVAVYGKDKKLLAEMDLSGARNAFCIAHPGDERCRGTASLWVIGIIVIITAAGIGVYLMKRQKRTGS